MNLSASESNVCPPVSAMREYAGVPRERMSTIPRFAFGEIVTLSAKPTSAVRSSIAPLIPPASRATFAPSARSIVTISAIPAGGMPQYIL